MEGAATLTIVPSSRSMHSATRTRAIARLAQTTQGPGRVRAAVDTLVDLDQFGWPALTATPEGLEVAATCRIVERKTAEMTSAPPATASSNSAS